MRLRWLLVALVAAGVGAGCGSSATGSRLRSASVVLDFTPNAVHAGIYTALADHLDRENGIRLHVVIPSATTDSIKLLQTGRVDFAVLDIHDLAIARTEGAGITGIMALVERPLAAVIAGPQIADPRRLEGQTVGVTGVPSDTAVLRSIVTGAAGDPRHVHTITIGFNAVADLLSRRVAAATAFWSDEGVTLAIRRPGFHSFRVDRYGAPSYPELVLCATARTLRARRSLAAATVRTLVAGYARVLAHPAAGAATLEAAVPGLDAQLVSAQLAALLPAFRGPDGAIGELNAQRLRAWAAWEARFGIVRTPPDVAATFDPGLAAGAALVSRNGGQ